MIERIVIHETCTAYGVTESFRNAETVADCTDWADTGSYHYVIENGFPDFAHIRRVERDEDSNGRVSKLFEIAPNETEIHVGLVGVHGVYSDAQLKALVRLCFLLCKRHGLKYYDVLGHCELHEAKMHGIGCPSIPEEGLTGLRDFIEDLMVTDAMEVELD